MALHRAGLRKEAEAHLDDMKWVPAWHATEDQKVSFKRRVWNNTFHRRRPLDLKIDLKNDLEQLVKVELGNSKTMLDACKRKLYIAVLEVQNYHALGEMLDVGCIATPAPKLSSTRKKVDRVIKNHDRPKGKDEHGNAIDGMIGLKLKGVHWVLLLDEFQGRARVTINDQSYSPDQLLSGFYGLQVWITHTVDHDGGWKRRTNVTMYGFTFRCRKTSSEVCQWKKRIIDSRQPSRVLSWSNSLPLQTLQEIAEEHSYLLSEYRKSLDSWKTRDSQYKLDLKTWENSHPRQSTLSRSSSDASGDSKKRLSKHSKTEESNNLKPKPPKKPRRKRTKIFKAMQAARERQSIHGSTDSSSLWDGSKITLKSLLDGISGLESTGESGTNNSTDTGGTRGSRTG